MRQLVMALALVLSLACVAASADGPSRAVPLTVWYQGFLADVTTGEPINGSVDIIVRLYTVPAGGSAIWGPEPHAGVTVVEGWFNIELGSTVPLPSFGGTTYFLDLLLDGELMSARMKLGSVPAAIQAAHADSASAGGGSVWDEAAGDVYRVSGDVGIGAVPPQQTLHLKNDQNATTGIIIENTDTGASSGERISFENEDGAVAFIALYDDDHGTYPGRMAIANNRDGGTIWLKARNGAVFIDTTGYVGVGTTSPAADLDVNGTVRTEGFEMITGAADGHVLTSDAAGAAIWQAPPAGGDSDWTVDGDDMYSELAGNLGIGTAAPENRVHITTDGSDDFVFESTANSGSVEFIAKTPDGSYDELKLSKYGPTASGTTAGVALAGLARVSSGVSADGLMLQASGDSPMYFAVNDTVRMRIDPDGPVNIMHVLHLEPTLAIPPSPTNGDMFLYGASGSQGLYIYINDFWELLVGITKESPNGPVESIKQ